MNLRNMYAVVWKSKPKDSFDVKPCSDLFEHNLRSYLTDDKDGYIILHIADSEDIARHKLQEIIDMK